MLFSIVVPCYNEEKNLCKLVVAFQEVVDHGYPIELVLVNNGSTDESWKILDEIAGLSQFVRVVSVTSNQGYGFGILAGLKQARGDYLGWLHADLQIAPKEICKAIRYLKRSGYPDTVFLRGVRSNRPVLDSIVTFGMSIFETFYLGRFMWDINAQPTLVSRKFYETWKLPPFDFSLDLYVYYLASLGEVKICRFRVLQHKRNEGISAWNTGMGSRIKLVKRVISYSRSLKREIPK